MIFLDPYIKQMRHEFTKVDRIELDRTLLEHEAQQVAAMLVKFFPLFLQRKIQYSVQPTTYGWAVIAELAR